MFVPGMEQSGFPENSLQGGAANPVRHDTMDDRPGRPTIRV